MKLVRYALWYTKLNLLWLFKYQRQMPEWAWYSSELIKGGTAVFIHNKRLHIVLACTAVKHNNPFGIALNSTDKYGDVEVLRQGSWWMIDAYEDMLL